MLSASPPVGETTSFCRLMAFGKPASRCQSCSIIKARFVVKKANAGQKYLFARAWDFFGQPVTSPDFHKRRRRERGHLRGAIDGGAGLFSDLASPSIRDRASMNKARAMIQSRQSAPRSPSVNLGSFV